MHDITRDMNLPEAVFLLPASSEEADVRARIFTPGAELPFAGHPTLGTAVFVGEALGLATVRLELGIGIIPVALSRTNGVVSSGVMQHPIPTSVPYERANDLLAA